MARLQVQLLFLVHLLCGGAFGALRIYNRPLTNAERLQNLERDNQRWDKSLIIT